jgi:hypothetical protein
MNCQSCECSLQGLHSYGKTLEENFCCVCWFAMLEGKPVNPEVKGEKFTDLEDAMWDLHILDTRECRDIAELLEILKVARRNVSDDIAAAEDELNGLKNKRYEIDDLLGQYERKGEKVTA